MDASEGNAVGFASCVMSPKEEHSNVDSIDWDENSKMPDDGETMRETISSTDNFDYSSDSNPANVEQWLREYFWNDSLRLVRAKDVSAKDFNAVMFGAKDKEEVSSAIIKKKHQNDDGSNDR